MQTHFICDLELQNQSLIFFLNCEQRLQIRYLLKDISALSGFKNKKGYPFMNILFITMINLSIEAYYLFIETLLLPLIPVLEPFGRGLK